MKKHIYNLFLIVLSVLFTAACSSDEPDYNRSVITIGNTEKTEFDKWLEANFVNPYNIAFKYRYEDIESDLDYYVVPAEYNKAVKLAHLVKYLCVDTYNEVAGTDFTLSANGSTRTMVLLSSVQQKVDEKFYCRASIIWINT